MGEPVHHGGADIQPEWSRDRWDNPAQFLLSCIGYSVGLGNVWRFPYLCYKHGGAAFLLIYLFLQLTIGKPLYFMELAMGQFSGKSVVRVWDMVPACRGIGFAMMLVSMNIAIYYQIIMTYVLYYFFFSFTSEMPWLVCQPDWKNCFSDRASINPPTLCSAPPEISLPNCTCTDDTAINKMYPDCTPQLKHSTTFFLTGEVMKLSDNVASFGTPDWKLFLFLCLSWVIVGASLIKGIKSTGKVVYFTATFPYAVLLIMLVRGCLLDGAAEGATLFIVPNWRRLANFQMWIDAAGQMFFSLSLCMGGITMYGSYNKFTHPVYRDALIISSMDLVTSILAGFVIFTTLGYMAKQTGRDIEKVVASSFGLAFVIYPEVLSTLALPNLWSMLFFFMLYTLGMDSLFALLETVMSFAIDDFKWCRDNNVRFRVGLCVFVCVLEIPLICPGGPYLIDLVDRYGCAFVLTFIGLMESVAVVYLYGVKRFLDDLAFMAGRKPRCLPYWYFSWCFWSPSLFIFLFFVSVLMSERFKNGDGTPFNDGMMFLCWLVFVYSLLPAPIWFALRWKAVKKRQGPFPNTKEFLKTLIKPSDKWGPADGSDYSRMTRDVSVFAEIFDLPEGDAAQQQASEPGIAPPPPPPPPAEAAAAVAPDSQPSSQGIPGATDTTSAPVAEGDVPADASGTAQTPTPVPVREKKDEADTSGETTGTTYTDTGTDLSTTTDASYTGP